MLTLDYLFLNYFPLLESVHPDILQVVFAKVVVLVRFGHQRTVQSLHHLVSVVIGQRNVGQVFQITSHNDIVLVCYDLISTFVIIGKQITPGVPFTLVKVFVAVILNIFSIT